MKKTALTIALLVLLGALMVTITTFPETKAATLFVGGAGPGNYTAIQAAIDDADPGDTVYVYIGTYNERLKINKTLTLIGESRNATIINGTGVLNVILVDSNWVNVTGFTLKNSGTLSDAGIKLDKVTNCRIEGNLLYQNKMGILLDSSDGTVIAHNSIIQNDGGIDTYFSDDLTVLGNNVSQNRFWGMRIYWSNQTLIANNSVFSSSGKGISLNHGRYNTILGNTVSVPDGNAIELPSAEDTIVTRNLIWSSLDAITLVSSQDNHVVDNTVLSNCRSGVYLYHSTRITVTENTFMRSSNGVRLWHADNNTITNNTLTDNYYGIHVSSSMNNTISDNKMVGNGVYLEGEFVYYWNTHSIDTLNTVNGKPLHYWKDIVGGKVPDSGQVVLANCNDVTIENQDVSRSTVGIQLGYSSGNTIRNVTTSYNMEGIALRYSNDNTIINYTVSASWWAGIYFRHSDRNLIAEGEMSSSDWYGLDFYSSDRNTVVNNSLMLNGRYGVFFQYSNENRIHHNDFVDNVGQAWDNIGINQWDDGYPSGGNYWSDYNGNDTLWGPNQDLPGSDGIGDTPYIIDGDSRDRYPLMSPWRFIPARPPQITGADLSGNELRNVTLAWSLSPDDGIGYKSVMGYKIFRNSTYDSEGLNYSLVASLPNGTSAWVDADAGEGNPNHYFYRVCAIDTNNNSTCAMNQAGKFTRPLSRGLNLVSVPLIQSNESIERVFQTVEHNKAWYYNSTSQGWEWFMKSKAYRRGLWGVNHMMGLWVNVTEDSNLTIAGMVAPQTTIRLTNGWNLIGFPSFNTSYSVADLRAETGATRVEGFDPSTPPCFLKVLADGDALQAGYGYWIHVDTSITWIVGA